VFSSKQYDIDSFTNNNSHKIKLHFVPSKLDKTTLALAKGYSSVCVFVNDAIDSELMTQLAIIGVQHIALRCVGFNNIDLNAAAKCNIAVTHVPSYSPEAVAEHTVAIMLTLNRHLHKAYNRVKEDNFSLVGLMGFNLHGKTVGIIGAGKIGLALVNILQGFGCNIICHDPIESNEVKNKNVPYVSFEQLLTQADIISLHCPLLPETHYMIDQKAIELMKENVMLINTSRGGVIKTSAVIDGLKQKKIGYLGLDVYEQESFLFFEDMSDTIIVDDTFQRLLTFPNVFITGHQGFFTAEAMQQIAKVTLTNIEQIDANNSCSNKIQC
jgi:D-lactate dehydrogenase